ncbi:unnamed protein product [Triticum turgidum subsp. durum]|uniref:Uncharacterized protein n=2 Tax=Triticum TaxID=4564 RepID=A0A9R0W004_TRITD|nr:unnamed protein product [Triticum turgidum subsp. durum]
MVGRRRVLLEEGGGHSGAFAGVGSRDGGAVAGMGGGTAARSLGWEVGTAARSTGWEVGTTAHLLGREVGADAACCQGRKLGAAELLPGRKVGGEGGSTGEERLTLWVDELVSVYKFNAITGCSRTSNMMGIWCRLRGVRYYKHGSHDPTFRAYKSKHMRKLNMSEYRHLQMKKAD